jgi:hypothetical protein
MSLYRFDPTTASMFWIIRDLFFIFQSFMQNIDITIPDFIRKIYLCVYIKSVQDINLLTINCHYCLLTIIYTPLS